MDAQQASAAQRENALQSQLADMSDRLNLNMAEAELAVDPEPVTRRCRVFIESRAFSKLANFNSRAASRKDWAFELQSILFSAIWCFQQQDFWNQTELRSGILEREC